MNKDIIQKTTDTLEFYIQRDLDVTTFTELKMVFDQRGDTLFVKNIDTLTINKDDNSVKYQLNVDESLMLRAYIPLKIQLIGTYEGNPKWALPISYYKVHEILDETIREKEEIKEDNKEVVE